jgi:glycosyltransferase involved in cell wall biosynthesis
VRALRPGLSEARNHGLAAASHAWVAYIDDDARVAPGWRNAVARAIAAARADVVCIGGPIVADWAVERPRWLTREVEVWFTVWNPGEAARESCDEALFCGANMVWRRDVLRDLGGFDPALGRKGGSLLSREESAAWVVAKEAGGWSRFEPGARVFHHVALERISRRWLLKRVHWEGISMIRSSRPERALRGAVVRLWRLVARPLDLARALAFLCGGTDPVRACHVAYKLGEVRELLRFAP